MKITRERLEEILREELAAVTEGERDYADNETEHTKDARGPLQKEGSQWDLPKDRFDPNYAGSKQAKKDAAEAAARKAKRGPGAFDNMRPEEPDDAFKGLSTRDITVDQPVREGGAQGDYNPVGDAMRKVLRRNLTVQEFPADVMANIERSSMLKPMHYNVKGSHGGQKHHLVWNDGKELLYINLGKDWKPVMDQIMKNLGYAEDPYGAMPAIGESITEGMGQALANTIREILETAVEELGKMHETGSAEYKAAMETLRKEVKLALGKDDLQENMFSNLKTNIDKVLRPGKYEDRKGTAFTVKRFNEAHESLLAAHDLIYEFDKPLAGKIMAVAGEVLKMRNQMRSGA